ncbi:hypothetical protein HJG60_010907 [Phyllostomus discolor]|uniref:Uncharacterized protein n=1 Tax=Phyllostomus discolor TaxID=89673 RepID=A0A834EAA4_9CHIR|nr:hypothetical protein HJG60_010907 [Phyllostomus discolor]
MCVQLLCRNQMFCFFFKAKCIFQLIGGKSSKKGSSLSHLKIPFLSPTRHLLSLVFAKKQEHCLHFSSLSSRAQVREPPRHAHVLFWQPARIPSCFHPLKELGSVEWNWSCHPSGGGTGVLHGVIV